MRRLLPFAVIAAASVVFVILFEDRPSLMVCMFLAWMALAVVLLRYVSRRQENRRELQADPNRCFFCGYDIRATPNRCPECGASPPTMPPDFFEG
jgi:predicted Zn-ribbon and HTH transcriptional regulator